MKNYGGRMDKHLLEWLKLNLGETFESPRKTKFKERIAIQDFKIVDVNEGKELVKIRFMSSGTILPLEFWRFDKALEVISKGEPVRLGTRLVAEDPSTLEYALQEHAKKRYGRKADTKTAPHVCDILVLSGVAEYDYVKNPKTKRKNQAVKKISK